MKRGGTVPKGYHLTWTLVWGVLNVDDPPKTRMFVELWEVSGDVTLLCVTGG